MDPANERRWAEIFEQRNLAIAVVGGLFFGAVVLSRIADIVRVGTLSASMVASLVLLSITFVLLLMWGWATKKELELLRHAGGGTIPPLPGSSFPLVVAAAVTLGALGVATAWPLVFAVLYGALRVTEALGYVRIKEMVAEGISRARAVPTEPEQSNALDALERYYLRVPWRLLQGGQILLAALAGILAAVALATSNSGFREDLNVSAYGVLIGAILVNESLVGRWRAERGRALPEAYR